MKYVFGLFFASFFYYVSGATNSKDDVALRKKIYRFTIKDEHDDIHN